MKRIRLVGLAAVLTVGLAAGCGGGSSEDETSTGGAQTPAASETPAPAQASGGGNLDSIRNDPCQMVTQAEAQAIFGRPAAAPLKSDAVGTVEASCYYSIDTANLTGAQISQAPNASVNIMFTPDRARGGMNSTKYLENARKGVATEPVAGVGDEAFCAEGTQIFTRVDEVVLNVVAKDCAMARQFAEKALTRL